MKSKKFIEIAKGVELEHHRNPKKGDTLHIGRGIKSYKTLEPEEKDFTIGIPGTKIKLYGEVRKKPKLFKK